MELTQGDIERVVAAALAEDVGDGDRTTLIEVVLHNVDRIRDIDTGPDGLIYLLTDGGDLLRLVPAGR